MQHSFIDSQKNSGTLGNAPRLRSRGEMRRFKPPATAVAGRCHEFSERYYPLSTLQHRILMLVAGGTATEESERNGAVVGNLM